MYMQALGAGCSSRQLHLLDSKSLSGRAAHHQAAEAEEAEIEAEAESGPVAEAEAEGHESSSHMSFPTLTN